MPSIADLGYKNNVKPIPVITEDLPLASVNQEIPDNALDLSKMTIDTFQVNQHMRGGASGYNEGIGWWIGRDADGTALLFFGDSTGNKVTWDGTTLTIAGSLTAGEIHIPDKTTANSYHVNSDGDMWIGCNVADFASDNDNAAAYILKNGASKFQNIILESNVTIKDLQTGSEIAIQGWQFNGAYSATDYRVVAWASGTLRLMDSTTYAITSGNTGNMTAGVTNYIYLDIAVSATVFQVTTTAATAVGSGKILVAVAKPVADVAKDAEYQVFGGKGGSSHLISVNQIVANSITANEMNVSQISAITSNLGTITAGTITGATIQTAASGSRVVLTSDNLLAYDDDGDVIFQINLTGTDVGDVITGDYVGGKGMKWDKSANQLLIQGDMSNVAFDQIIITGDSTINGINPVVSSFGGDGSDGILNVTSGTTNIAIQKWQYNAISVASGATLSTTGTTGIMYLLCQQDMTVTGTIDFSDKITDLAATSAVNLYNGDTFTPTGKKNGNGGGGGGGSNYGATAYFGGDGGDGTGGGAGGKGGGGGLDRGGAGGGASGGSTPLGNGTDGVTGVSADDAIDSAGGGGVYSTSAGGAGGGAGTVGGSGYGVGADGDTGFGADGGDGMAGGGASGGESGNGGVDTIINIGADFDGTSGTIKCDGGDGDAGGDGGDAGGGGYGGGGGGGGDGGDAGELRLVYGESYVAPTITIGAGAAGGAGNGGAGTGDTGDNGVVGDIGASGSSTIKTVPNVY